MKQFLRTVWASVSRSTVLSLVQTKPCRIPIIHGLWVISLDTWTSISRTLRRDVKLGAPLRSCSLPVLLHTQLPTVCTYLRHSSVRGTQGQLGPNQEKGSLRSLRWIQATKAFNKPRACIQPCTKGWKGMWLGPLHRGALFAGRAERIGREGKQEIWDKELSSSGREIWQ